MPLAPLTATDQIVNVYLNSAQDEFGRLTALISGYTPGDPLRHCFRLPLDETEKALSTEQIAGKVFHLLNVGDDPDMGVPDQRALAFRLSCMRSLSVGDVLEIDGAFLAVASLGFTEIEAPDRDTIAPPWR